MNVSTITKTPSASAATSAATAAAAAAASSSATATPDTVANPANTLNQADFLKLLVAQIQYQDPMNPQSDTQMAAQMAQFTTLQQTTQSTNSLAMMQANSLIGSTVTVQVDSQNSAQGVVTGVTVSSGTPEITINNTNYSLSQITGVVPNTANSSTGTNTGGTGTTTPADPATTSGAGTGAISPTTPTTN